MYANWNLTQDSDNILWLYFDKANASVNSFDQASMMELNTILDEIHINTKAKALVIGSAKEVGYIAGVDIKQAAQVQDEEQAYEFIRNGQCVFDKIESLKIPTIAMISGFCLGGGMEMALACQYRVAEDGKNTRLGLPEVLLGIHPGWGGTVRMLRLLPITVAMSLMLTGRTLTSKKAKRLGLVDASVPQRQLLNAVKHIAITKPAPKRLSTKSKFLHVFKPILCKLMLKKLKSTVDSALYPAPYALVKNFMRHNVFSDKSYEVEARSVAKLLIGKTSKNLVRVYFLQEMLKGYGKSYKHEVKHVHVIGAGTMGGDIAVWCAYSGFKVTLHDTSRDNLAATKKRAFRLFKKKCEKHALQMTIDRLVVDVDGEQIKNADVIIEAVFEDVNVKRELLKSIESKLKPTAVLATNTSSIPLEEIASSLVSPERLVGIHFFNPVAKMKLVEVVSSEQSDKQEIQKAISFVHQINRLPLPVKSSPGFLVNRILLPYLMESMLMVDEGIAPVEIDNAAKKFGMPMGPIELADTIGLDVCLSVSKNFQKHFEGSVPSCLINIVNDGKFGAKNGGGFYEYKNRKLIKPKLVKAQSEVVLQDRLISRMLNEAVACLQEGVVEDGNLLDAGMIFGTGFAPCSGGPISYINTLGVEDCLKRLNMIQKHYEKGFSLSKGWQDTRLLSLPEL